MKETSVMFRDGAHGLECRCLACDTWMTYWGAPVIAIGKLIRLRNPRYGLPMATGAPDERKVLVMPKIRHGYGCSACVAELESVSRVTERGRTPFLMRADDDEDRLFDPNRSIPAVVSKPKTKRR